MQDVPQDELLFDTAAPGFAGAVGAATLKLRPGGRNDILPSRNNWTAGERQPPGTRAGRSLKSTRHFAARLIEAAGLKGASRQRPVSPAKTPTSSKTWTTPRRTTCAGSSRSSGKPCVSASHVGTGSLDGGMSQIKISPAELFGGNRRCCDAVGWPCWPGVVGGTARVAQKRARCRRQLCGGWGLPTPLLTSLRRGSQSSSPPRGWPFSPRLLWKDGRLQGFSIFGGLWPTGSRVPGQRPRHA